MFDDRAEPSEAADSGEDPILSKSEADPGLADTAPEVSDPTEELRREKEELYDRLLRTQAEFDNFRKRTSREKEELRLAAQADLLAALLPSVDACEKGLASLNAETATEGLEIYRKGYELLLKEIQSVLVSFGVVRVAGVGSTFDPNVHEAVVREITSDFREGQILEEFRKGYLLKDRLLRPSQVKVAAQPEEESAGEEEE